MISFCCVTGIFLIRVVPVVVVSFVSSSMLPLPKVRWRLDYLCLVREVLLIALEDSEGVDTFFKEG
jgi:hypothetical protein